MYGPQTARHILDTANKLKKKVLQQWGSVKILTEMEILAVVTKYIIYKIHKNRYCGTVQLINNCN